jgi:hypothetical protein
MKKISTFFLIGFLFLFNYSNSQVSIGVKAGLTLSKLKYNSSGLTFSTSNLASPTFGIPIEFRLSDIFALQSEINFITKGGSQSENYSFFGLGIISYESEMIINYIEVPVLAKVSLLAKTVRVNLLAGPAFAYGLSGKTKSVSNLNGVIKTEEEKINFEKDDLNRLDISVNLGIGSSLNIGTNQLFLDIRYQWGLLNMDTSDYDPTEENLNVNSETLMFNAGILFAL